MTLNLKNSAENEKMNKGKKPEKSQELIAAEQENKLLKEQLDKLLQDQESLKLEKDAEKLAKEQAALKEEADLRQAIQSNLTSAKTNLKEDQELSPEQILAITGDAVGAATDAQGKLILNQVGSMLQKQNKSIEDLQKLVFNLAAGVSVNQLRSQHDDYDNYKTEIAGIMSTTRGLSAEDAYILAKAKKGEGNVNQQNVSTERPGEIPDASSYNQRDEYINQQNEANKDVHLSPKQVFSNAVSAAIDKTIASRRQ